jgi:hypothetical protein
MLKASVGMYLMRTGCPKLHISKQERNGSSLVLYSKVLLALGYLLFGGSPTMPIVQRGEGDAAESARQPMFDRHLEEPLQVLCWRHCTAKLGTDRP